MRNWWPWTRKKIEVSAISDAARPEKQWIYLPRHNVCVHVQVRTLYWWISHSLSEPNRCSRSNGYMSARFRQTMGYVPLPLFPGFLLYLLTKGGRTTGTMQAIATLKFWSRELSSPPPSFRACWIQENVHLITRYTPVKHIFVRISLSHWSVVLNTGTMSLARFAWVTKWEQWWLTCNVNVVVMFGRRIRHNSFYR